jgi:hypothetical protein
VYSAKFASFSIKLVQIRFAEAMMWRKMAHLQNYPK